VEARSPTSTAAISTWRNHGHGRPPLRGSVTREPSNRPLQADASWITSPYAMEEIYQAKGRAYLYLVIGVEPHRDRSGCLGPGSYRLNDRPQWLDRTAAELGRIPGMDRRLIACLPRHLGPALMEALGHAIVVRATEIARIEEGNVHVAHIAGAETGPVELAPHQITQDARPNPGIRDAFVPHDCKNAHHPVTRPDQWLQCGGHQRPLSHVLRAESFVPGRSRPHRPSVRFGASQRTSTPIRHGWNTAVSLQQQ
jgi:hypothetical protein